MRLIYIYFFLLLSSASLSCVADDDRSSKKEKNNIITRLAKKFKDKKATKRKAKKRKELIYGTYNGDWGAITNAFYSAIESGNFEIVRNFLDIDKELFARIRKGFELPLQHAVAHGNSLEHVVIARELIESGCPVEIDEMFFPEKSILVPAIMNRCTPMIKLLLEKGADPHAVCHEQSLRGYALYRPLMYVKSKEDAQLLMNSAPDVLDQEILHKLSNDSEDGITALMKHIEVANKEVVYFLIQQGASLISPNHKDGFVSRHNALYHAMVNDHEDVNSMFIMGRWLLYAGAFFKILEKHIAFGDIDGGSDLYLLDQCNQLLLEYSKKFPRVLSLQNLARNVIREQAPKNEQLRNNANHLPAIVFQYTEEVKEDLQHWLEGYVPLQLPYGFESTGETCE